MLPIQGPIADKVTANLFGGRAAEACGPWGNNSLVLQGPWGELAAAGEQNPTPLSPTMASTLPERRQKERRGGRDKKGTGIDGRIEGRDTQLAGVERGSRRLTPRQGDGDTKTHPHTYTHIQTPPIKQDRR